MKKLTLPKRLFLLLLLFSFGLQDGVYAQKNVQLKACSPCTSTGVEIKKETDSCKFEVFPNPNSGSFILGVTSKKIADKVELQLFNSVGMLLYCKEFKPTGLEYYENIHVDDLPAGIYLIHLFDGVNLYNEKVIINR